MHADVPLGAFLSGGIDSTTVVALMQAQSPRPVRTFTIGFHEAGFNEARTTRGGRRPPGDRPHRALCHRRARRSATIPSLPELWDEPFADASQIPTLLVAAGPPHVTVCLSGDGGDELFGGYSRYLWTRDTWRRIGWLPARRAPRPLAGAVTGSPRGLGPPARPLGRCAGPLASPTPGDRLHKAIDILPATRPRHSICAWSPTGRTRPRW